MERQYKNFLKKVLELRGQKFIRHRDITVLLAMLQWINFEDEIDIRNKKLVNISHMDKSDVSKSVKKLIQAGIIIENDMGYKLNKDILNISNQQ